MNLYITIRMQIPIHPKAGPSHFRLISWKAASWRVRSLKRNRAILDGASVTFEAQSYNEHHYDSVHAL